MGAANSVADINAKIDQLNLEIISFKGSLSSKQAIELQQKLLDANRRIVRLRKFYPSKVSACDAMLDKLKRCMQQFSSNLGRQNETNATESSQVNKHSLSNSIPYFNQELDKLEKEISEALISTDVKRQHLVRARIQILLADLNLVNETESDSNLGKRKEEIVEALKDYQKRLSVLVSNSSEDDFDQQLQTLKGEIEEVVKGEDTKRRTFMEAKLKIFAANFENGSGTDRRKCFKTIVHCHKLLANEATALDSDTDSFDSDAGGDNEEIGQTFSSNSNVSNGVKQQQKGEGNTYGIAAPPNTNFRENRVPHADFKEEKMVGIGPPPPASVDQYEVIKKSVMQELNLSRLIPNTDNHYDALGSFKVTNQNHVDQREERPTNTRQSRDSGFAENSLGSGHNPNSNGIKDVDRNSLKVKVLPTLSPNQSRDPEYAKTTQSPNEFEGIPLRKPKKKVSFQEEPQRFAYDVRYSTDSYQDEFDDNCEYAVEIGDSRQSEEDMSSSLSQYLWGRGMEVVENEATESVTRQLERIVESIEELNSLKRVFAKTKDNQIYDELQEKLMRIVEDIFSMNKVDFDKKSLELYDSISDIIQQFVEELLL